MEFSDQTIDLLERIAFAILCTPLIIYMLYRARNPTDRAMPNHIRRLGRERLERKANFWKTATGIAAIAFAVGIGGVMLVYAGFAISQAIASRDLLPTADSMAMPFMPVAILGLIAAMICGPRYHRLMRFVKQFDRAALS